jgi:hypothetical protein
MQKSSGVFRRNALAIFRGGIDCEVSGMGSIARRARPISSWIPPGWQKRFSERYYGVAGQTSFPLLNKFGSFSFLSDDFRAGSRKA